MKKINKWNIENAAAAARVLNKNSNKGGDPMRGQSCGGWSRNAVHYPDGSFFEWAAFDGGPGRGSRPLEWSASGPEGSAMRAFQEGTDPSAALKRLRVATRKAEWWRERSRSQNKKILREAEEQYTQAKAKCVRFKVFGWYMPGSGDFQPACTVGTEEDGTQWRFWVSCVKTRPTDYREHQPGLWGLEVNNRGEIIYEWWESHTPVRRAKKIRIDVGFGKEMSDLIRSGSRAVAGGTTQWGLVETRGVNPKVDEFRAAR